VDGKRPWRESRGVVGLEGQYFAVKA